MIEGDKPSSLLQGLWERRGRIFPFFLESPPPRRSIFHSQPSSLSSLCLRVIITRLLFPVPSGGLSRLLGGVFCAPVSLPLSVYVFSVFLLPPAPPTLELLKSLLMSRAFVFRSLSLSLPPRQKKWGRSGRTSSSPLMKLLWKLVCGG